MYRDKWSSKGGVVKLSRKFDSPEVSLFDKPRTGRFAADGKDYDTMLAG